MSASAADIEWDVIVVGAGSAGCAAVHALTRSGKLKVLLIEAGGSNRSLAIRVPALVMEANRKFDWGYRSEPDPSRHGHVDSWLRGRVLGGSSSVNGMLYVRGAAADFDEWARDGCVGWSSADLAPLFAAMERSDLPSQERGARGPVRVRTVRGVHPLTRAFMQAAAANGIPINADYNGARQEGVGLAQLSQWRGFRWSAADAFLDARARAGATILTGRQVQQIRMQNGRAVAVCVRRADGSLEEFRGRHIVLSAGAIASPQLLMLSGIGDPGPLQSLGVAPTLALPGVGRNLMEHPLLRLVFGSVIPSYNLTGGLPQKLGLAWRFLAAGQGLVATAFEAAAFIRTSSALERPDVQLHVLPIGLMDQGPGASPFLDRPSMTIYVNASYPLSRGSISLQSPDIADAPRIEHALLGQDEDAATLVAGIRKVRAIMAERPMAALLAGELLPGEGARSDEALLDHVRAHTELGYHPSGTCRMGVDGEAVVGPDQRVRGTDNLWIADASIMPRLISGNTNAFCMLAGFKLGRALAGLA